MIILDMTVAQPFTNASVSTKAMRNFSFLFENSDDIYKNQSCKNHNKAGNPFFIKRNPGNAEPAKVVDDCRNDKLSCDRDAGHDGNAKSADAVAGACNKENSEKTGRIKVPGHSCKLEFFMDKKLYVEYKKNTADGVDHKTHAEHAHAVAEHTVQACHSRLTGSGNESKKSVHTRTSLKELFISILT